MAFTSLNAATTTGVGSTQNLLQLLHYHTMVCTVTGAPTQLEITLEGSLDNSSWITLGTVNGNGSCHSIIATVQYVRANLTIIGGGTSPTVTAKIASGL